MFSQKQEPSIPLPHILGADTAAVVFHRYLSMVQRCGTPNSLLMLIGLLTKGNMSRRSSWLVCFEPNRPLTRRKSKAGLRKAAWKEPLSHWLPLFIHQQHAQSASWTLSHKFCYYDVFQGYHKVSSSSIAFIFNTLDHSIYCIKTYISYVSFLRHVRKENNQSLANSLAAKKLK